MPKPPSSMTIPALIVVLYIWGVIVPAPLTGQQVPRFRFTGRITTPGGVPLPGAEVTVLERTLTATSDSGGRFVIDSLDSREYTVRVRRIGFRAQFLSLHLRTSDTKEYQIVMESAPVTLPEVEVTAPPTKPAEYAFTHKYDDFFRRKRVGLGGYITREDIERLRPNATADVLRTVGGVHLIYRQYGIVELRIRSCRTIGVWIDGAKQPPGQLYRKPRGQQDAAAMAAGDVIAHILPSEIEMIEVYRGPSEMPAEFLSDECAIVIWTR
jgi:hypothetical protein